MRRKERNKASQDTTVEEPQVHHHHHEQGKWECHVKVEKWHEEHRMHAGHAPDEVVEHHGNLLLTAGLTRLLNLLIGTGSTQALDSTHTRIGVGDGSTAPAIGNTDLSAAAGSTHRWFQVLDQTPTVSTNVATFHATFASGDGNFAWNEFGIDVSASAASSGNTVNAVLLNRAVPGTSLGTKTGGSWAISVTLTIS